MDKIGSGLGQRMTAEQEREANEKIIRDYKPRGTHTLGALFGTKRGAKKTSSDD